MVHTIYLSLGSNLGNRHALLKQAIELLQQRVGSLVACSSMHETEPWGFESENNFLNAAVCLRTSLSPVETLLVTQEIEREMGRTKKSDSSSNPYPRVSAQDKKDASPIYHDRTIDIDILIYDNLQLDTCIETDGKKLRLTIPHPLMQERDFVMKPLKEIL